MENPLPSGRGAFKADHYEIDIVVDANGDVVDGAGPVLATTGYLKVDVSVNSPCLID
ncbi:hypothetical protein ABT124_46970 [Streptomyces sp. NPDC001982]|uniref:hypothetical protein n=1 Tax=Streptomyces sp. NPDC001982 TaxID=3154405 RepID=UPI00332620E1